MYNPDVAGMAGRRYLVMKSFHPSRVINRTMRFVLQRILHGLQNSAAPARMIIQAHDELVFEVTDSYVEEARRIIPGLMAQAAELSVPLLVDVGVGDNWDEAH